jgi:hypothetical protein
MSENDSREIAACGLVCTGCDMMLASDDPALAQQIAEWFKTEPDEVVKPEDIHCGGCDGDRDKHWSPDGWILLCCVDEKGFDYCSVCERFPCEKLDEWAGRNDRYATALERLKGM